MGLFRGIQRYRQLNPEGRARHREAAWRLARASMAIHTRSFRTISRYLERAELFAEPPPASAEEIEQARELGAVIARVARHLPWAPACLAQVLALQSMMSRRSIPGAFYLGAKIDRDDDAADGSTRDLTAHAWLLCGDTVVNGGAGSPKLYPVLATFSWR